MKLAVWTHIFTLLNFYMAANTNKVKPRFGGLNDGYSSPFQPRNIWKEEGYVGPIEKPIPYGKHQRDIDRYVLPKVKKERRKHGKKFDSTLGYPGEGPSPQVTECKEGVKCMIAGHYHQLKSPLSGAAKRKRDSEGKKPPRSSPVYVKCDSIANIQCCKDEHAHDCTQCLDCHSTRSFVSLYQDLLDSRQVEVFDDILVAPVPVATQVDSGAFASAPTIATTTINTLVYPKGEEAIASIVVAPVVSVPNPIATNTMVYPKGEEALASIVVAPVVRKVLIFTTAPSVSTQRWWLFDLILRIVLCKNDTVVQNVTNPSELSANVSMFSTQESSFTSFLTGAMKWFGANNVTCVEYFTKLYPTYYVGEVYQDCVDVVLSDRSLAKRRPVDPDGVVTDVMTVVKHVVNSHASAGVWISNQRLYLNTLVYCTNCVVLRGLLEAAANPRASKTVFRSADLRLTSQCVDPLFA